MRKLDPRIDQAGVINTFKKAGVQQALNIVSRTTELHQLHLCDWFCSGRINFTNGSM